MRMELRKEQVPWAMAAGRAVLGPVLILGELAGWNGLMMAWLVVTALVSDIFDGVLARRWRCDTAGMRLFDSMSDTFFYVCVAIALWIGQPRLLRDSAGLLAVLVALEAVRFGVDLAKFGKPASYHSYLAKAWGLVIAAAVVVVLASPHMTMLIPVALMMGIACDVEGLAMSLVLPVWRRNVKTLQAAWQVQAEVQGMDWKVRRNGGRMALAGKTTVAAVSVLALVLVAPAFAVEPGQAVYAGGTSAIALETAGTLDTTSPTDLIFKYRQQDGKPGEVGIAYAKIRSFEPRNDVVRHLGFLPAVAAGLVAARQRRYTVAISYADSADAVQVAIFQVTERDQVAMKGILRARAPQGCMVQPYRACGVNPAMQPAVGPALPPK